MEIVKEVHCLNCGAPLLHSGMCAYCEARFIVKTEWGDVPFVDVKGDAIYLDDGFIEEMLLYGYWYCFSGRLTAANLTMAIANLTTRRYQDQERPLESVKYHLVIPPALYVRATILMESEKLPGTSSNDRNTLPRFIDTVWVDVRIPSYYGYNIPWLLSVVPPQEAKSIHDLYYSSGTTP
jgi:hypothetical protein